MRSSMSREAWARRGRAAKDRALDRRFDVRTGKGIGPNKACGHKGGISRQGSKRG